MRPTQYSACILSLLIFFSSSAMNLDEQRAKILQEINSNPTLKESVEKTLASEFVDPFNNRKELTTDGKLISHGIEKRTLWDINEEENLSFIQKLQEKP